MSGWWYTYPSEKYEFVKWDYCSQYTEKKKCSKPPISIVMFGESNGPKVEWRAGWWFQSLRKIRKLIGMMTFPIIIWKNNEMF